MSEGSSARARIERLRVALGRRGPGAFLTTHLPNVRWLCGFSGSAGAVLVTRRDAAFFTDFRYRAQAAGEVRGVRIVETSTSPLEAIAANLRRHRIHRVGFESDHITMAAHTDLAAALRGVELVALRGVVEGLRAVKDAGEIASIRRALRSASLAFAVATRQIVGRSEREVAECLRMELHRARADGEAFPSIVASGPRGALPHALPTAKRIRARDLVVVDFGAKKDGYNCDVTRTLFPKKWEQRKERVYRLVLEAQAAAISKVKAGVPAREIDAAARQVIEKAGYGSSFGHSTGHGVGLEVHEKPNISARSGEIVLPGMVFTIEPGIYLEHFGGVRIEDMVLVTRNGCEVLSRRVPKYHGS